MMISGNIKAYCSENVFVPGETAVRTRLLGHICERAGLSREEVEDAIDELEFVLWPGFFHEAEAALSLLLRTHSLSFTCMNEHVKSIFLHFFIVLDRTPQREEQNMPLFESCFFKGLGEVLQAARKIRKGRWKRYKEPMNVLHPKLWAFLVERSISVSDMETLLSIEHGVAS